MQDQLEKLILKPLSQLQAAGNSNTVVDVVKDALYECNAEEDIEPLIGLFSHARTLQPICLRISLTSRPELPIRLGFSAVNGAYQDITLHGIPEPVIKHDLRAHLEHELGNIGRQYNQSVGENRTPKPSEIETLAAMATPLFIAATVCHFIKERKCGNPDRRLRTVVE